MKILFVFLLNFRGEFYGVPIENLNLGFKLTKKTALYTEKISTFSQIQGIYR